MRFELRGGPLDGGAIEVDAEFVWADQEFRVVCEPPLREELVPEDFEEIDGVMPKTLSDKPYVKACYRWLFGKPDHLDFAGYAE